MGAWSKFVENKTNWSLAGSIARFEESMTILHDLKPNDG
jgi:hypothetical protein